MSTVASMLIGAGVLVGVASAEDFVYQGSLTDNGQPADGVYDLTFDYYTVIAGGASQLTATREDVAVAEGVFQVSLPMPPSDGARFLGLGVRDGASTGAYTTLSPRTFIASTPYATKAFNVEWERNGSGFLGFGDGNDIVLINRDNRIGSEYFGVHADTSNFGGMYVSTSDVEGLPFYGYNAGTPFESFAYHYMDGLTGNLLFNVGSSIRFQMQADGDFTANSDISAGGNLLAGGNVTAQGTVAAIDDVSAGGNIDVGGDALIEGQAAAASFVYNSSQIRKHAIPPAAFKPVDMSAGFIPHVAGGPMGAAYVRTGGSTASMAAPLQLPDNARITSLRASIFDGEVTRLIQVQIRRTDQFSGQVVVGFVGTSSTQTADAVLFNNITDPTRIVNNNLYSYEVLLAVGSNGWPAIAGNLSVRWVMIEYLVDQPD